jgi:epoxyqueuosine reductase QueG
MTTMINSEIVKEYGFNAGASVVGIAASKDFDFAPEGFRPTDALKGCLSVIVLGASFPHEALDNSLIYTEMRKEMIEKINGIAKNVAKRIKGDGYKAREVCGFGGKWVEGNGRKEQFGLISLKHAAELAGLGVIGKNYLLINPQYGNLLWFSAVLTDADLIPDKKSQDTVCNNCNLCVEMCPVQALENTDSFGKKECSRMFMVRQSSPTMVRQSSPTMKQENGKWVINCFLCRKVCPGNKTK